VQCQSETTAGLQQLENSTLVRKRKEKKERDLCQRFYPSRKDREGLHRWQQNIGDARYFIKHLTDPGDLVLDTFLGTGTTGIAALKLKRRFMAVEIVEKNYRIALGRIRKELRKKT